MTDPNSRQWSISLHRNKALRVVFIRTQKFLIGRHPGEVADPNSPLMDNISSPDNSHENMKVCLKFLLLPYNRPIIHIKFFRGHNEKNTSNE